MFILLLIGNSWRIQFSVCSPTLQNPDTFMEIFCHMTWYSYDKSTNRNLRFESKGRKFILISPEMIVFSPVAVDPSTCQLHLCNGARLRSQSPMVFYTRRMRLLEDSSNILYFWKCDYNLFLVCFYYDQYDNPFDRDADGSDGNATAVGVLISCGHVRTADTDVHISPQPLFSMTTWSFIDIVIIARLDI